MSKNAALKRPTTAIALAFLVAACGSSVPAQDRVPLLTGYGQSVGNGARVACSLDSVNGLLTADPVYGTRLTWDNGLNSAPIMWTLGFTARSAGAEVEVLDERGNVIAITGRHYWVESVVSGRVNGVHAFSVCNIYPADS